MVWRRLILAISFLAAALPGFAQNTHDPSPVEPGAGQWRTWVISSGKDYRVPPPPPPNDTRAELRQVADLVAQNDEDTAKQIAYWDAGSPQYRWMDLISTRLLAGTPTSAYPHRVYAYVSMAMYDATIATWDAKYYYGRPRPTDMNHRIQAAVDVPNSPSYPSEHAAVAHAAAAVLAYFLPAEAATFQTMAEQAGWSRVLAGVQFPSDYDAGAELGKRIADQVIAKAKADGSDAVWPGSVPQGACNWKGSNPVNVTATGWTPLLMSSASQFRPPQPPACDSQQVKDDVATVRNFPRGATAFGTNYKAFYWQSPEGLNVWPYRHLDKWMFESGLDRNPPRAARAYALLSAVMFDAFIASQDGKFQYWYIRPSQLDAGITPIFPVPNHPSYPSNHSTFSRARAEVLAYLFPDHAAFARSLALESGESRIWAGIHYPMDNAAGQTLGQSVAGLFIEWAKNDGSK